MKMPRLHHLDFAVDDLDEGERHALTVGATRAEFQPGEHFRVLLDLVGHHFCRILAREGT